MSYYNPVNVHFGIDKIKMLNDVIDSRRALLITSKVLKDKIDTTQFQTTQFVGIIDNILPNPDISDLKKIYDFVWIHEFDVIVALGGGSVIDAAKVLSVKTKYLEKIIKGNHNLQTCLLEYEKVPVIAIPTTAGTGSEVTPWATIWDSKMKQKYSLQLPDLWCEACICDPTLTLSLPLNITIQTALDALSHSFESIWNKNANTVSTDYAIKAAIEIIDVLPLLIKDLNNIELRDRALKASLYAGLAFSNTKTAIAHAFSYYLTINKGVPHGIACSLILPDIIDVALGINENIDSALKSILLESSSRPLRDFLYKLGISTKVSDYGISKDDLYDLFTVLRDSPRAGNSLVSINSLFDKEISAF